MSTDQLSALEVTIEQSLTVGGAPRWLVSLPGIKPKLLILSYRGGFYTVFAQCPHGQTALINVPLSGGGSLVCPSHGQVIDITQNPAGYSVLQTAQGFQLKPISTSAQKITGAIPVKSLDNQMPDNDAANQTLADLQQANSDLRRKVLSGLESMDQMLHEVESKKAELEEKNANLSDINELIDGITNTISELLIVTDNRGVITRINHYAEEVFHCSSETLEGSSPDLLLASDALTQLNAAGPQSSWDTRPAIYQAVYRNQNFQLEVNFQDPLQRDINITQRAFLLRGKLLYSRAGEEIGLILTATDISQIKQRELKKRQDDLEKHLLMLRSTLATLGQGVAMFNEVGDLNIFNSNFGTMTGITDDYLQSTPAYDDLSEKFHPETIEAGVRPQANELLLIAARWVQKGANDAILACESHPMPEGGFVLTLRDITQRRQNEEHIRLLSTTVEQSSVEVVITDTDGIVIYVNPMFIENTGYSAEEAIGSKSSLVQSGEMSRQFYEELWGTIKSGRSWKGEILNRKKNGEKFWQLMTVSPIKNNQGETTHFLSLKSDITRQKAAEAQLRYQAEHDLLTNLPNRQLFISRLESTLEDVRDHGTGAAILYMDLDNFKDVNDSLGHLCGDVLLQLVSQRLANCISEPNLVARLGGDEFAILIPDLKDTAQASQIADTVIQAVGRPYKVDDHLLHIGVSMGITVAPDDSSQSSSLLSNADMAMYSAKEQSGSHYQYYDLELQQRLKRKRQIETHLRHAIENNEFTLMFQPKHQIEDGRLVGAEALLRWHQPEIGHISPAEFIPIAEQSGQIIEIGNWVTNATIDVIQQCITEQLSPPQIAINLSTIQLRDINLCDDLQKLLEQYQISTAHIELEITETAAMADPDLSMQQLEKLKSLGISIAMDDFGTGYSSLSYLSSLPVDRVKIDRSFVNDIEHSEQARAIIQSIIHLGKILKKTVIAEGVENQAQLQLLHQLGCQEVQGYLIARPLSALDFFSYIKDHQQRPLITQE